MITNDIEVRLAAFDWLSKKSTEYEDVIPRSVLAQGFVFQDHRIRLMGPQGIFKPRVLSELPISITTAPQGPYDDSFSEDGFLLYKYRGTNPQHHENAGLRKAMITQTPLIYFHGVVPGKYLAVWPVFIVGDMPKKLTFKVAADDINFAKDSLTKNDIAMEVKDSGDEARRAYITSNIRIRLHQRGFREKVLHAYKAR